MENKLGNQESLPRPPFSTGLRMAFAAYNASMALLGTMARAASPLARKFAERSGVLPSSSIPCSLWVHACSAGEMTVAHRFIDCWTKADGPRGVFLSAWTRDGHRIASSRRRPEQRVGWFPVDSRAAMRCAYDAIRPRAVVLCETEMWPNHLAEAQTRNIPVFVINGRMSERDAAKYARLGSMAKALFAVPETVFAQSAEDARRFSALGARRTIVTGNMKFDDMEPADGNTEKSDAFPPAPYILAASTHRGEEASVFSAFKECRQKRPELKLVIAPRHVRRSPAIVRLAQRSGLRARIWPRDEARGDADCIVVGQIGLLRALYLRADLAFVGKSLHAHGGQNFLEAVEANCAVVLGPHTENFDDMLSHFTATGAVWQVGSPGELREAFAALITDSSKREGMAVAASRIKREHSGATEKTVREILARL